MFQPKGLSAVLCLFLLGVVSAQADGLAGDWHGSFDCYGNRRFALVIEKSATGYQARFDDIDYGLYGQPFDHFQVKGRKFHGVFEGDEKLDLYLNGAGRLAGTMQLSRSLPLAAGRVLPLELTRGMDYSVPRVDSQGRPVMDYSYQVPAASQDGLETGSAKEAGGDIPALESAVKALLRNDFPHTHSLLVLRHGKLVLEEYFYGYGAQDEHQLQSTSKSVLSMLFGLGQDRGLVQTGQRLFDLFPGYRSKPGWDDRKSRITLGTLLSMTSGFGCDDLVDRKGQGGACEMDMLASPDWLDFCLNQPMAYEPGRHYAYCTSCLSILSAVLSRQSGMPLPDFAQKYLYDPLGIQAGDWVTGPDGTTEAGASFWLKPRDMAKLGQMYLDGGKWKGKQVVSRAWVEASTRPQPLPTDGKPWPGFEGYGYLWWTRHLPSAKGETYIYYSNGKGGQYIIVAPSLDLVCVMTAGYYQNYGLEQGLKFFQQYILNAFS